MNTELINILSNFSYLIAGLYLIHKNYNFYGLIAIIMWTISHIYHTDTHDSFWANTDMIFAFICFMYVMNKCYNKILCTQNIILLILLLINFSIGFYYFHNDT